MKHSTHRDLLVTYWLLFDDVIGDVPTLHPPDTADASASKPNPVAAASRPASDDPS